MSLFDLTSFRLIELLYFPQLIDLSDLLCLRLVSRQCWTAVATVCGTLLDARRVRWRHLVPVSDSLSELNSMIMLRLVERRLDNVLVRIEPPLLCQFHPFAHRKVTLVNLYRLLRSALTDHDALAFALASIEPRNLQSPRRRLTSDVRLVEIGLDPASYDSASRILQHYLTRMSCAVVGSTALLALTPMQTLVATIVVCGWLCIVLAGLVVMHNFVVVAASWRFVSADVQLLTLRAAALRAVAELTLPLFALSASYVAISLPLHFALTLLTCCLAAWQAGWLRLSLVHSDVSIAIAVDSTMSGSSKRLLEMAQFGERERQRRRDLFTITRILPRAVSVEAFGAELRQKALLLIALSSIALLSIAGLLLRAVLFICDTDER
jgi:hypothetical protein